MQLLGKEPMSSQSKDSNGSDNHSMPSFAANIGGNQDTQTSSLKQFVSAAFAHVLSPSTVLSAMGHEPLRQRQPSFQSRRSMIDTSQTEEWSSTIHPTKFLITIQEINALQNHAEHL
jgi:hypothetical protein